METTLLLLFVMLITLTFAGVMCVFIKLNMLEDFLYGRTSEMPDLRYDEHEDEEQEVESYDDYLLDSRERNEEMDKRVKELKEELAHQHIGASKGENDVPVEGLYDLDASTIPYKNKVEHEYAD